MGGMKLELDPEVEGLLREIAADPRSTLLRIPRPVNVRAFAEDRPAFGVATAGLTKAERHLVQTRREEVARHLLLSIWFWQTEGSSAPDLFSRQGPDRNDLQVPSFDQLALEREHNHPEFVVDAFGATGLLRMLWSSTRPSESDLVAGSLLANQLAPSPHASIHAVASMLQSQDYERAAVLGRSLLGQPLNRWIRAVAMTNLGLTSHRTGDLSDSLHYYAHAAEHDPGYAVAAGSYLLVALQLGDTEGLAEAAHIVDQVVSTGQTAIERLIRQSASSQHRLPFRIDLHTRDRILARHSFLCRRLADVEP